MMSSNGTKSVSIKLCDFGLARALAGTADCAQTVAGTPYYMSPEQVVNSVRSHKACYLLSPVRSRENLASWLFFR